MKPQRETPGNATIIKYSTALVLASVDCGDHANEILTLYRAETPSVMVRIPVSGELKGDSAASAAVETEHQVGRLLLLQPASADAENSSGVR